jgi:sugar transferase (PEP-CTERM/EpsH1 system associated)
LHVVHVVLSLDVGGLERNVVNQVREGHSLGQRVSVVCLERPGVLAPRVEELGGAVVSLDKRPGIRPGLFDRLRRALRRWRPDVVHTHQIPTLFYTGPAARALGRVRVVHTEHGLPLFRDSVRARCVGRLSAAFCDRFFCLTEEMARAVKRYRVARPRKVLLIRNGIEPENYTRPGDPAALRAALGIPEGAAVIGTVGRLAEIKQYDVLLRAFARVKRAAPDAHLVLVGDGPLGPSLRQLAETLGINGYAHFVGYQTNVSEYLHAMNCFVLPSRSEGTPQAVLEASVARVPVVATRVGGLPEVIDDGRTGILVPSGDEDALTREITRVIRDTELAARLGMAARARVQSMYGVARMAREYHRHYVELLSGKAST